MNLYVEAMHINYYHIWKVFDEPLRRGYARMIRRERGMNALAWEKMVRECQVMSQEIDLDSIMDIFHKSVLHEPREDGAQPLLRYNEFIEAIVTLTLTRTLTSFKV